MQYSNSINTDLNGSIIPLSKESADNHVLSKFLVAEKFPNDIIEVLIKNDITLSIFTHLNSDDFKDMGITNVGLRKRLEIHARSLKESTESIKSLNKIGTDIKEEADHFYTISTFKIYHFLKRLVCSCLYAFLSFGVTSFVMVLAHERLPDISKYPPLPDILLDNLPYIDWAFEAAETIGLILGLIWSIILVFHRHRLILLRRICSLMGTVFLLRSTTMIITSLSVPGRHLAKECSPFVYDHGWGRIARAFEIWFGFGLTLRGVRTCGDYMFSGHTTCITLLSFFITEYTPGSWALLHTFCWILTVFGIFFILAAHEHYSIDVFIAIYISSRLFLYYHTLANNKKLMKNDKQRTRIWFPLFYFFENNVNGIVPNEFKSPLRYETFSSFLNENCDEDFIFDKTSKQE